MKKAFILRLTRVLTAIAAVVGIALHPAGKLVDGVSGATRQKSHTSNSDDNSIDSENDNIVLDNSTSTSNDNPIKVDNATIPSNITPSTFNNKPTIPIGWIMEGSDWKYVGRDGATATGWLNDSGKWYYLSAKGIMLTGWVQTDGKWYYLANSGAMQTGWFKDISGSWYYLDSSGAMLANTTIGGYTLGYDGRMQ